MTRGTNYDVKCMMCSAEVGQIIGGKFLKHRDCSAPMPRQAGMLRCCHCGGSLYLDPTDVYPSAVDRTQIARIVAEDAA